MHSYTSLAPSLQPNLFTNQQNNLSLDTNIFLVSYTFSIKWNFIRVTVKYLPDAVPCVTGGRW